jgi:ADP-heptose:LPS heptosyltransferase
MGVRNTGPAPGRRIADVAVDSEDKPAAKMSSMKALIQQLNILTREPESRAAAIEIPGPVVQTAASTETAILPPLIPPDLLATSDRILFIAHLALGDFTYLESCFKAFAQAYPHIKIHLFVDERRRITCKPSDWEHLKKYSLYDWLAECPYFAKVYDRTYSPALFEQSVDEARRQDYPIVVSLAILQRHRYAALARKISPRGFVVGQKKPVWRFDLPKHLRYRKLDAFIPAYTTASHPGQHISDIYAGWFTRCFGIAISPQARFPVLHIPEKWLRYAREQFIAWGSPRDEERAGKVVFLNSFSKSEERCWPLEKIVGTVRAMRLREAWRDATFIVNAVPEELARVRKMLDQEGLEKTYLFSAEDNFFQLPAILSLCDLIISVETAVMHLANAVHVPVLALMRQLNPEWEPIDKANSTVITVTGALDWVDKIGVAEVMSALERMPQLAATARP